MNTVENSCKDVCAVFLSLKCLGRGSRRWLQVCTGFDTQKPLKIDALIQCNSGPWERIQDINNRKMQVNQNLHSNDGVRMTSQSARTAQVRT